MPGAGHNNGYTCGGTPLEAVASLGWVTPWAATEGVTPLFFPEKSGDLFLVASSAVSPLISSSQNLTTFFCSSLYRFLLLSLGCHPLEGVTLHLFYLSELVSPLFFVICPHFFPSGVTPLEGVTRGGPPPSSPPLVTPLAGTSRRLGRLAKKSGGKTQKTSSGGLIIIYAYLIPPCIWS